MPAKSVIVAMSGGVDSAVAAFLLKEQGYSAAGATFLLWDGPSGGVADARAVCEKLGIQHYVFDFREQFRDGVMEYFAAEYRRGRTPNPCVACNRRIKFGAFLEEADRLGFDYIATGHYARASIGADGMLRVRRAASLAKDQSYALWRLGQNELRRALFPLGELGKPEVRRIAEQSGLPVSRKAESQDICFVPDGDYAAFLRDFLGDECPSGDFVDEAGIVLGRHRGVWSYTVGQRKGLGLSFERPMYVTSLNARANTITLGPSESLFCSELRGEAANWPGGAPYGPVRLAGKIRYGAEPAGCVVTPGENGALSAVFDSPQRAITPGQSAVFYDGDLLVAGAVIAD